jgi:hypothetical protein
MAGAQSRWERRVNRGPSLARDAYLPNSIVGRQNEKDEPTCEVSLVPCRLICQTYFLPLKSH